ncbi:MAG TPA: magnesium transporter, partial [Chromatiales bacterium]|nr:magnesium transporter [Chromatiales bacterium]
MAEALSDTQAERRLDAISDALDSGALQRARQILAAMNPAEIAHLLESLPAGQRFFVWRLVDPDDAGEVLIHVGDEVRAGLLRETDRDTLLAAAEVMETDDLADLLSELPDAVTRELLQNMDRRDRERVEAVLSYDEDTAGG